jgi:hypothetical protein
MMWLIRTEAAFAAGFRRSVRGNLWRRWAGGGGRELTLTVFPRRGGSFAYAIADEDGPAFSTQSYETEGEAVGALWRALGGDGAAD